MHVRSILVLSLAAVALGCSGPKDRAGRAATASGPIRRLDPALDSIVAPDATVEKVADGFEWTEGPLWIPDGYLLFAAIHQNSIMKWVPGRGDTLFLHPSGYQGLQAYGGPEPGSNGMTLDAEGRLTVAGHARRVVYRLESLEPGAQMTVLADRYQGKRLNSPNDVVYASDGSLYFTDPPYGLPTQRDDDPLVELPFAGVYRLPAAGSIAAGAPPANDRLELLVDDLTRPNGVALSPDEKVLYVSVSDPANLVWMRYDVLPDHTVAHGGVFARADATEGIGGPDGIKVDRKGNVYGSGPGGVWILSPQGKHLGTIILPERASNVSWGGPDARTLYISASSSIYSIRLEVGGVRR